MFSLDLGVLTTYVTVVLSLAAISTVASLSVVSEAVVRNRRTRLSRHESLRTYDGCQAPHD
ncbi:MAG: hypothetical protein J2P22_20365 [Nocardioides sp.]|nr:hypothetical protein [Nocardioides sp.]